MLVAEAETLAAFAMARGEQPVVAHDWKTIAMADDACAAPPLEHDTMVAAYLIDPARRGYPLDELRRGGAGLGAPTVDGADGVAERAVLTRAARRAPARAARRGRADATCSTRSSCRWSTCWSRWSAPGIKLDVERLRAIGARFNERVDRARAARSGSWPARSSRSARRSSSAPILFEKLGLSRKRRGKTGFSTDARVLQAIRDEHEIIPAIEEWRELTKLKSTYLDAFPELIGADGRLHTTFNQTAATTGRLSSTNPNLQNIPIRTEQGREIRACFVAEEGCRLISADYSQVELRMLAHIADEQVLKEIFRRGEDVHTATAGGGDRSAGKTDPGTRSKAKMVNFGIVYGLSALRARRPAADRAGGGAGVHRPLPRALPGGAGSSSSSTIAQASDGGLRDHAVRPHRRDPGAALAQLPDAPAGRAAGGQHGHPGHRRRHHQGRDGARARRAARRRPGDAAGAADPRRAAVRGPRATRSSRRRRSSAREMDGAFELDPPLEVDVGVGANWLEAK